MDLIALKQRFGIIGNSELLNRALEVAVRVAPTDLSVLVTGESGVGKEFFPQIIHAYSARKHNKYIAVNCGAIPEGTIDSELFGHEKGSFTGAVEARKGYFEEADGGTIFLDEVAELPLSTQVRLLRVLQTGEFLRVGSAKVQKTNVRVVAATNMNLQEAIERGRFREDLYYRLNTVPIAVPALRERREDIFLLFRKFASDVAVQYRMPAITLDDAARKMLEGYYWRGNIRQLKNVAEQISAIEENRVVTAPILARYLPQQNASSSVVVTKNAAPEEPASERELLYKVLFDMRADINDLKRMVSELMRGAAQVPQEPKQEVAGYLPTTAGAMSHARSMVDAVNAEVVEEPREPLTKADAQREQIIRALRHNNGRRREAAAELFMSERTLYRKIKELGIEEKDLA
ncbi:sigma-54 dependent transcriptional regulator [uncultured Alistipes sp.]|uniref:sigma-54 interaction domain-containing protein n=1 Tax=uncultured Alistipes sp. TaxID=538949 RepID=UPI00262854CA|nr:sigma-54 dependent transcriptional regulator [uncultured Alistipes sp.]